MEARGLAGQGGAGQLHRTGGVYAKVVLAAVHLPIPPEPRKHPRHRSVTLEAEGLSLHTLSRSVGYWL